MLWRTYFRPNTRGWYFDWSGLFFPCSFHILPTFSTKRLVGLLGAVGFCRVVSLRGLQRGYRCENTVWPAGYEVLLTTHGDWS